MAWDLDQVCLKELRVTGSNASVPSAWRTALRLLANGSVHTAPLISDVYSLPEWFDAFQRFERREGNRTAPRSLEHKHSKCVKL